MRRGAAPIAGSVFALLAGCGDDPPQMMGPPPPSPTVEIAALCEAIAKSECSRLEKCALLYPPIDNARCLYRIQTVSCAPVVDQIAKAQNLGHLSYDPLQGGKCRDAVGKASCDLPLGRDVFAEPECARTVSGKSGEGGSCTIAEACTEGLFCDVSQQICPGTCRKLRGNNETCGTRETICAPQFFCSAMARRCRARVALDAPCEPSIGGNPCAERTWCDTSMVGGPKCVPVRGRNTACTSGFECAPDLICIRNLCSDGGAGAACRSDRDCTGKLRCGGNGRCAEPLAAGVACDPAGPPCKEGLTCTSSTGADGCVARALPGETCDVMVGCYLSRCDAMTMKCVDPVADGGGCTGNGDCLPGRACTDSVCETPLECAL